MSLSEASEHLKLISEMMNEITEAGDCELNYDLLAGSLYWSDEFPADDQLMPIDAVSTMRIVTRYRTFLILGKPDERCREVWEIAKTLFPNWIGFHPDRCSENPDLAEKFLRMQKESWDASGFDEF